MFTLFYSVFTLCCYEKMIKIVTVLLNTKNRKRKSASVSNILMDDKKSIRLAIVGYHNFNDKALFDAVVSETLLKYNVIEIISGGATGADAMAKTLAEEHGIAYVEFPVNWRPNGVYDKAAGIKRNTDIVNRCTHMVAFPSKEGRGTQDSIKKAEVAKKPVTIHWV